MHIDYMKRTRSPFDRVLRLAIGLVRYSVRASSGVHSDNPIRVYALGQLSKMASEARSVRLLLWFGRLHEAVPLRRSISEGLANLCWMVGGPGDAEARADMLLAAHEVDINRGIQSQARLNNKNPAHFLPRNDPFSHLATLADERRGIAANWERLSIDEKERYIPLDSKLMQEVFRKLKSDGNTFLHSRPEAIENFLVENSHGLLAQLHPNPIEHTRETERAFSLQMCAECLRIGSSVIAKAFRFDASSLHTQLKSVWEEAFERARRKRG